MAHLLGSIGDGAAPVVEPAVPQPPLAAVATPGASPGPLSIVTTVTAGTPALAPPTTKPAPMVAASTRDLSTKAVPKHADKAEAQAPASTPPLLDPLAPAVLAAVVPPAPPSPLAAATGHRLGAPAAVAGASAPVAHGTLPNLPQSTTPDTQGASAAAIPIAAVNIVPTAVPLPDVTAILPAGVASVLAAGAASMAAAPATPLASSRPPQEAGATPAPAAQVAAVIVQVSHAAPGPIVTLRLDPGELGQIQVRVERTADGVSAVHVAVERPETLRLLTADQPQLHRALDLAGLPQDGRSLSLTLASPDSGATGGGSGMDSGGGGGQASSGGGGSNAGAGSGRQQERPSTPGRRFDTDNTWRRAGVDITA